MAKSCLSSILALSLLIPLEVSCDKNKDLGMLVSVAENSPENENNRLKHVRELSSKEREIYKPFIQLYNSIDMSDLSAEEKEFMKKTDRKDFVDALKKDITPETIYIFKRAVNLNWDNPSDKDMVYLYRYFEPIYQALGAFMQAKND